MLPQKAWKTDAILRLVLSVIICYFAGSFVIGGLQYAGGSARQKIGFYLLMAGALGCLATTLVMLRKPWRLENSLMRLALVLVCFYIGLLLGFWAYHIAGTIQPSIGQMIVSALSLQGAVLVLLVPFLREHQTSWSEAFGFRNHWGLALLLGLAVGCIFFPIGRMLQDVSGQFMLRLHLRPEQQQVVQTLRLEHASASRAVFGAITLLLVPPAEEALFRGILYPWIKRAGYPRLALWGTSLAFAAIHMNLMIFLPLALFALALTVLYEKTGNLLAPITAHALFNAANLLMLYLMERALG